MDNKPYIFKMGPWICIDELRSGCGHSPASAHAEYEHLVKQAKDSAKRLEPYFGLWLKANDLGNG